MIKLYRVTKKITNKSRINLEMQNKTITLSKWNSKNINPIKKGSLYNSNNSAINSTNKTHLSSKKKNSSQPSDSNKPKLSNPRKLSTKNFLHSNFNSKLSNNNLNSHNKKILSLNRK